jgi:hypothetical protein
MTPRKYLRAQSESRASCTHRARAKPRRVRNNVSFHRSCPREMHKSVRAQVQTPRFVCDSVQKMLDRWERPRSRPNQAWLSTHKTGCDACHILISLLNEQSPKNESDPVSLK